jgi:hypothetical protein
MKHRADLMVGPTVALIFAACGSSSSGATFFCDRAALPFHSCDEYVNLDSAMLADQKANCMRSMETAVTACPSAALLGTCTLPSGYFIARTLVYSDVGGETDASASMFCYLGGGAWTSAITGRTEPPPFSCGTQMTCAGTQWCWEHEVGTIAYVCHDLPPQCTATTPTCACLLASFDPGTPCSQPQCMDDGAGHLSLLCVG